MKRRYRTILLVLAVAVVASACDREEAEEEVEPTPLEELDDGLPPTGPFEGAHDASEPVAAEDFESKLVDSFCLAYDNCRNDPLRALVFQSLAISSSMVANQEGDQETGRRIRSILGRMEREDDVIATREECQTVIGFTFAGGGLDGATIEEAVEAGTAVYHADRAGQCMAQFGEPFDLCTEVRHLQAEPDPERVMESMGKHGANMEEHFAICNRTIEGRLEVGDECRHGFECGENAGCDVASGAETGVCVELAQDQPMGETGGQIQLEGGGFGF